MRLNSIFVLNLLVFMILIYPARAQVIFSKTVIDTSFGENSLPFDLNVADINGDNELDVVVSSPDNNTGENSSFFWLENDGNEIFSKNIIDSVINGGGTFDIGDLDGDLDNDIILAASGKISWYENNGSGSFQTTTIDFATLPRNPFITDFDSDGDKDIVFSSNNGIFWANNDSIQNFNLDTVEVITIYELGFFVTDLDDDLNTDVVVQIHDDSTNTDLLVWYKNIGSENFTREQIDTTVENITQIVVDDLNDDGFKDIILIDNRESGDGIYWYNNDGNENFLRDTVSINFNRLPRSLQVADIDGDNDKDVIVTGGNNTTGEVVIYENDGDENFSKNIIDNSAGNRQRVYVVDIDTDDDLDLFVTNILPFEVIFYRNDGLAGIENESLFIAPDKYSLEQNYPNPFNPSTTIEFSLPKSEHTTLKVFNILGKEVTILVSKKLNSGNHTYQFDGSDFASGIYYYQLVAGDYREVKKMILLK